jgi:CMP-N,N'-diacetyllegionaminic acid synthase
MGEIFALIPARAGSKGLKDKNIKLLAGHPLMAFSIAAAKRCKNINRVIVSTNSKQYADIAKKYGAEVPFLRPEEISQDKSTDYDFVKHALDWFSENEGRLPQMLVHLRPTTPLRQVKYIQDAVEIVKKDTDATALRSVHKMSESAYKMFEIENGILKRVGTSSFELDRANDPRQGFTDTYFPNGYVDVLKTSFILENKKIHGNRVFGYVTPFGAEVDGPEDFEYLEYLAAKNPKIVSELFG